eukprot:GHVN01073088.1.p1 GENE.GHVN01073088.1~~GHVN01073088.1.p1  ORF type:complete len:603 (-),score=50.13 GHVN01073088.1:2228-4036(-)
MIGARFLCGLAGVGNCGDDDDVLQRMSSMDSDARDDELRDAFHSSDMDLELRWKNVLDGLYTGITSKLPERFGSKSASNTRLWNDSNFEEEGGMPSGPIPPRPGSEQVSAALPSDISVLSPVSTLNSFAGADYSFVRSNESFKSSNGEDHPAPAASETVPPTDGANERPLESPVDNPVVTTDPPLERVGSVFQVSDGGKVSATLLEVAPRPPTAIPAQPASTPTPTQIREEALGRIRSEIEELYVHCSEERLLKVMVLEIYIDEEIAHQKVALSKDAVAITSLDGLTRELQQYVEGCLVHHRVNEAKVCLECLGLQHLFNIKAIVANGRPSHIKGHSLHANVTKRVQGLLAMDYASSVLTGTAWQESKFKNLELKYKMEKNHSVTVRVRGKLKCRLSDILAVLSEPEAAPHWVPFLKSSTVLHSCSRASTLVHQQYDYPFPIGKKESLMYAFGIDTIEENGFLMCFCLTPPDVLNYKGYPLPPPKLKRLEPSVAIWLLHPSDGGTRSVIEVITNASAGMPLPATTIKWLVTRMARSTMVKLANLAINLPGSDLEKQTKGNPDVYEWVQRRGNAFYGEGHHKRFPTLAKTQLGTFCGDIDHQL